MQLVRASFDAECGDGSLSKTDAERIPAPHGSSESKGLYVEDVTNHQKAGIAANVVRLALDAASVP